MLLAIADALTKRSDLPTSSLQLFIQISGQQAMVSNSELISFL